MTGPICINSGRCEYINPHFAREHQSHSHDSSHTEGKARDQTTCRTQVVFARCFKWAENTLCVSTRASSKLLNQFILQGVLASMQCPFYVLKFHQLNFLLNCAFNFRFLEDWLSFHCRCPVASMWPANLGALYCKNLIGTCQACRHSCMLSMPSQILKISEFIIFLWFATDSCTKSANLLRLEGCFDATDCVVNSAISDQHSVQGIHGGSFFRKYCNI